MIDEGKEATSDGYLLVLRHTLRIDALKFLFVYQYKRNLQ